jgi:electron transfer flavoprotein alpha/beta subunit
MGQNIGARYEIIVDGKPRSYRDDRAIAIEAGMHLKEQRPTSEVIVRDIGTNSSTAIGWEKGKAFIQA